MKGKRKGTFRPIEIVKFKFDGEEDELFLYLEDANKSEFFYKLSIEDFNRFREKYKHSIFMESHDGEDTMRISSEYLYLLMDVEHALKVSSISDTGFSAFEQGFYSNKTKLGK
jgi:hypothetical protein